MSDKRRKEMKGMLDRLRKRGTSNKVIKNIKKQRGPSEIPTRGPKAGRKKK